MKSRLFCEALETRENPSSPAPLDPVVPPYSGPAPPPGDTAPAPQGPASPSDPTSH